VALDLPSGATVGFAVALGAGLLIGIERERRKGQGDDREAAGLRTFIVTAGSGALAQGLPTPGLVWLGALLVAALAAVAYWKSRSRDPGLTTELALFATYLIGVQSMVDAAFGAACGAGLAALLAAREQLHRVAISLLTEQEVHDGLLLVALALIVLPLLPAAPLPWLGGIQPRALGAMVLLIMALQAAGQMAWRWLGPRRGVLVSGFVAGFVSSTATIASHGSQARAQPAHMAELAGGAVMSAAATWVQAVVMSAALSPAAAWALLPVAAVGAGVALAVGARLAAPAKVEPDPHTHTSTHTSTPTSTPASTHTRTHTHTPTTPSSALRLREALIVASLLAVVASGVSQAQLHFGASGLAISVAVAALVDAHSPIASLASLQATGSVGMREMLLGMLVAMTANSLTRSVVAVFSGGLHYGWRVASALLLSLCLAWAMLWWMVLR
jgi:uncharacterized membrane protein (DUF4010 family)